MKRNLPKKQSVNCNVAVTDCEYFRNDPVFLPPKETYTLVIDYPFSKWGSFKIKTGVKGMCLGGILKQIHVAYVKQYEAAEIDDNQEYWHGIEDLAVEGIAVDHVKKEIRLSMGS